MLAPATSVRGLPRHLASSGWIRHSPPPTSRAPSIRAAARLVIKGVRLARFLGRFASGATVLDDRSIPLAQAQDAEMVEENTRLVKEAAARGVVILGRNGALILGDIPTALHVQLDAPVEVRIARAAREEGLDLTHATRRQRNEDWVRAEMSQRFYYWNPMDIDRYDLVVNTGVLDLDTAVDVIVAAYQAKAARATAEPPPHSEELR